MTSKAWGQDGARHFRFRFIRFGVYIEMDPFLKSVLPTSALIKTG